MFSARVISRNNIRLLNICDSNLLGKTIISEKLSIKISESYYGEKLIKKAEAENLLKKCGNINMVGKEIISLSVDLGIASENGVKKIDSINKKFDHNYHQAMMEIEKEDVGEGTVVQEIQPGYIMYDRLLRPAMVGVSKKPSTKKLNNIKEKTDNKEKIKSEENQEK